MADAQLTPWFSCREQKPKRKGVYEIRGIFVNNWFRYFDGRNWRQGGSKVQQASSKAPVMLANEEETWRGYTTEQQ